MKEEELIKLGFLKIEHRHFSSTNKKYVLVISEIVVFRFNLI